jgi:hypothetical protein
MRLNEEKLALDMDLTVGFCEQFSTLSSRIEGEEPRYMFVEGDRTGRPEERKLMFSISGNWVRLAIPV